MGRGKRLIISGSYNGWFPAVFPDKKPFGGEKGRFLKAVCKINSWPKRYRFMDWLRKIKDHLAYRRWLRTAYAPHKKYADIYKVKGEYHFVALHQTEIGVYMEDDHAEISPVSMTTESFVSCVLTALQRSKAGSYAGFQHDRERFLKKHKARSYTAFYTYAVSLNIAFDTLTSIAKVSLSRHIPSQGQGLSPVEGAVREFKITTSEDWGQIRPYFDGLC